MLAHEQRLYQGNTITPPLNVRKHHTQNRALHARGNVSFKNLPNLQEGGG